MTAPPPNVWGQNCERKKRYADQFAARVAAQEACVRTGLKEMGVYQCPICKRWHISRKVASRRYRVTATDLVIDPETPQEVFAWA